MSYFSEAELARYRGMVASSLPRTCSIHTKSNPPTNRGGRGSTTYSPAEATFDCRIGPSETAQQDEGGSIQQVDEWEIVIPPDVPVTLEKVIRYEGNYYEIAEIEPRSYADEIRQVLRVKRSV